MRCHFATQDFSGFISAIMLQDQTSIDIMIAKIIIIIILIIIVL